MNRYESTRAQLIQAALSVCAAVVVVLSGAKALAQGASGGSIYRLGVSAMQDETVNKYSGSSSTDTMTTHINGKLGYVFSNGIYFGLL